MDSLLPPFNYLTTRQLVLYLIRSLSLTKPKNPLFSFNVRGSLGHALSFARRHRQQIAEAFPTHPDAKTAPQLLWRTMYQKCTDLWHTLSPAEKDAWESAARRSHMTGYAYYMSLCLRPNPGVYLPLAGGTMQGAIGMSANRITDLPAAAAANDPTRKAEFDALLPLEIVSNVLVSGSPVDYVNFTSLDINTDLYYLLFFSLLNAGISSSYSLFCNSDYTKANYYSQYLYANAAVVGANRANEAVFMYCSANNTAVGFILIHRDANGYYSFASYAARYVGASIQLYNRTVAKTATVANITALRVASTTATQIAIGTRLLLFRPRNV